MYLKNIISFWAFIFKAMRIFKQSFKKSHTPLYLYVKLRPKSCMLPLMSSSDPSSQIRPIIPQRVCLKWLLLCSSLLNSIDEIREIPGRWDFHCACADNMYPTPPRPTFSTPPEAKLPVRSTGYSAAWADRKSCVVSLKQCGLNMVKYGQSYQ